jgi:LysM repeat protein
MRQPAIFLTLLLLILASSSCQEQTDPATETPIATTPRPTPALNVTFVTFTPGPQSARALRPQGQATRPPPTPTMTATPILYTVRSGDTLVGIAAANGVTLDELLALNPDVQPELLMIGQQISLPLSATAAAPILVATDEPFALEVQALAQYSSVSGGMWVLGEVRNNGPQPAELIQVEVKVSTLNEGELARETIWLTPVTLPAGGKAPFGVLFQDIDVAHAEAEAQIVSGRPVFEMGIRYLDLAVSDAQVTIGRSPNTVLGRLENGGQQPAGQISVITTFYDSQGAVTGFHELALEGAVAPGESTPFQFIALPPGGRVDDYDFAVQAVVVESPE